MHLTRQPRHLGVARSMLFASMLVAGTASAQTSFTGAGTGPIPDYPVNAAGCHVSGQIPLNVTFNVTGVTAPLTAVSVATTFAPAHSWGGDITATLIAPGGAPSFLLFGRLNATTATGAGTTRDLAGPYTFVNGGVSPWPGTATPIPAGNYCTTPTGGAGAVAAPACTDLTAAFAGLTTAQVNGTWTLRLTDGCDADTGTLSAATLTLTGAPTNAPPQFAYAPAAGSTVTATGGGAVGSTGAMTITPSVGTAGVGTGAPSTTTLTCTAPTAPFTGFGQTVTAVGAGAMTGGPMSGTCTLGAAAVTQTLTCNENRGGTANARTWTLQCPAGTLTPLTSTPVSGSTVPLGPRVVGGGPATASVQFSNPNAAAVTVTCTAPAATQFTVSPLTINVPASGSASTTISYTQPAIGTSTGTLSCTAGAQTLTFTLNGSTVSATAASIDTIGPMGKLLMLLAMLGIGLVAVRRH